MLLSGLLFRDYPGQRVARTGDRSVERDARRIKPRLDEQRLDRVALGDGRVILGLETLIIVIQRKNCVIYRRDGVQLRFALGVLPLGGLKLCRARVIARLTGFELGFACVILRKSSLVFGFAALVSRLRVVKLCLARVVLRLTGLKL